MCRSALALFAISLSLDVGHGVEKTHVVVDNLRAGEPAGVPVRTGLRDEDSPAAAGIEEVERSLAEKSVEHQSALALELARNRAQHAAEWRARTAAWNARLESFMQAWGFEQVNSTKAGTADDPADSQEVPYYFFNFPLSIKFMGTKSQTSSIVLLDKFKLFDVQTEIVYIYPIVLFVAYTMVWCICCMRSNRTGLSFRVICEAATCFMCLWADLATKHKVISASRAWSYIIAMVMLLTGWNVATMVAGADNLVVFALFQSLVALVWLFFAIERMFVRKMFRRTVDPMSGDHYCADCALQLCCGQFTALQEAQFMAEVGTQSLEQAASARSKSGGSGKW